MKRPHDSNRPPDRPRRVEATVSAWLRIGVVSSVLVILAGLVVSILRHPDHLTDPKAFLLLTSPGAAFPHSPADLATELLALRGRAIITVGVLLLIATPVVRVGVSLLAYWQERDWIYTTFTALVLAALVISFAVGAIH